MYLSARHLVQMQQSLANCNGYVPKEINAVGKIVFGMTKT
jgi:hypothetical protein